ncbi:MAG: hypothetical protein WCE90_05290 [Candidatus Zixiibacteriota bacterium]
MAETVEKRPRSFRVVKWSLLSLVAIGIIALAVMVLLPHKHEGPPKISFSETWWDFGRMPQQSSVSHVFWVKNVGGDTLRIIRVDPG